MTDSKKKNVNSDPQEVEDHDKEIMTADEVAELCRVNRKTVYDAYKNGQLPGIKIGRLLRFRRSSVLTVLSG